MSTRTQITVEGQTVKLYCHHDGYPEGILPDLLPFVSWFIKECGFQEDYMMARLTQRMTGDDKGVLSFGLDTEWHGDLEWAYVIRRDGSVDVYRVGDRYVNYLSNQGFDGRSDDDTDLRVKKILSIPLGTPFEEALEMIEIF